MFKLTIRTENEAFDGFPGDELARILRDVAEKLQDGRNRAVCVDVNGNTVGSWELTSE